MTRKDEDKVVAKVNPNLGRSNEDAMLENMVEEVARLPLSLFAAAQVHYMQINSELGLERCVPVNKGLLVEGA
jgi:hypothetical protein